MHQEVKYMFSFVCLSTPLGFLVYYALCPSNTLKNNILNISSPYHNLYICLINLNKGWRGRRGKMVLVVRRSKQGEERGGWWWQCRRVREGLGGGDGDSWEKEVMVADIAVQRCEEGELWEREKKKMMTERHFGFGCNFNWPREHVLLISIFQ